MLCMRTPAATPIKAPWAIIFLSWWERKCSIYLLLSTAFTVAFHLYYLCNEQPLFYKSCFKRNYYTNRSRKGKKHFMISVFILVACERLLFRVLKVQCRLNRFVLSSGDCIMLQSASSTRRQKERRNGTFYSLRSIFYLSANVRANMSWVYS